MNGSYQPVLSKDVYALPDLGHDIVALVGTMLLPASWIRNGGVYVMTMLALQRCSRTIARGQIVRGHTLPPQKQLLDTQINRFDVQTNVIIAAQVLAQWS